MRIRTPSNYCIASVASFLIRDLFSRCAYVRTYVRTYVRVRHAWECRDDVTQECRGHDYLTQGRRSLVKRLGSPSNNYCAKTS